MDHITRIKTHVFFWTAALLVFFGALYVFKSVLLPFVLAFVIAYLLAPIMAWLNHKGLDRTISVLSILLLFFSALGLCFALFLPIAYRELIELSDKLPELTARLTEYLAPYINYFESFIGQSDLDKIRTLFVDNAGSAASISQQFLGKVIDGSQAFIGALSTLIITPVLAFFVMRDWDNITNFMYGLMPRDQEKTIRDLLKQMDQKVSGFIRGQLSVALALGVLYAITLSIAGLNYGVLVGLIAGALNIIPLLGSTIGLIIGAALAWFQTGDLSFVGIIAGIFVVGQIVEGNFLSPKLIGKSVGMHPLWIFFSLMAGGALFGLLGMLLAVPVVAIIGVLVAFAISRYKASPYYKGAKKAPKKRPAKKKG